MKWLFLITFVCLIGLTSGTGTYVLSRVYEGAFFYGQYHLFGINDSGLVTKMSFSEKIICNPNDYSAQMEACLKGNEPDSLWLFSQKRNMKTFWGSFDGKEYIIKKHVQHGILKNMLRMGKCVSIWNNLHWAKERGVPLIDPVAVSERRSLFCLETIVVYRYEGVRSDYCSAFEIKSKSHFITDKLCEQNVVHSDLRRRNIVCTSDEEDLKLIDVELMHFYPPYSYVCRKRLQKEEKWLLKDYKH